MAQLRLGSEHHLSRDTIALLEGRLCLGLVNTKHPRLGRHVQDILTEYRDLVIWNRSLGMLTPEQERRLLQLARTQPEEAVTIFERALALREASFGVFSDVASGSAPKREDLDVLQGVYAEAMRHAYLSARAHDFSWEWGADEAHGEVMKLLLWPAAHSVIELLTASGEMSRLKECPGCGYLFLDTSKTGNRRWCSMNECGSRAKMRRQYARKRAQR
jgi:predicted RNA-binding Zn ribbon-like protein